MEATAKGIGFMLLHILHKANEHLCVNQLTQRLVSATSPPAPGKGMGEMHSEDFPHRLPNAFFDNRGNIPTEANP